MSESPIPKTVLEFSMVARGLCDGLERGLLCSIDEVMLQLVRVQFCAMRLPPIAPVQGDAPVEPVAAPALDLSWLPDDMYWEVMDPFAMVPEEPSAKSLVDDLLLVHAELRRALHAYDAGHIAQAWWDWRCGFYGDWGEHMLSAQRALFLLGRR